MQINRPRLSTKERILATIFSTILFIATMAACQRQIWWVHNTTKTNNWVSQNTSIVCISVANDQIPTVIEAVTAWDNAIRRWKHLQPVIGLQNQPICDYTIIEVEPNESVGFQVLGSTTLFGKIIYLYKNRYEIDALTVTLHELGHSFGAIHMNGTLMSPQIIYNTFACPDAATVAQVAQANNLDPTTLSWCVSK